KLDPDAIFMQCGGDAVIYGRFAPTSYTVSFDSGDSNHSGSNLTVGAINSMSVAAGTWFNPYAIAELDSYVSGYEYDYLIDRSFIGWYNGDTLIDQNTGILVNGNLTLTAKWEKKCRVEFSVNKGTATAYKGSNVIYVVPGKTLNPYGFFSTGIYDSDIGFQYYFGGSWCTDNSFSTAYERTDILIEKDTVFYSDWLLKTKIILSFDGATPTWTGCTSPELEATEMYLIPGTEITVSVTYSGDNNQTFSVTPNNVVTSQSGNSKSIKVGTETITISASSSCIAAGTLITLADGTQKKVEDLLETDILLVFDHETGTYVECPILFIERDGWAEYNIINLTFSNGTTARLIYEHALFDLTLNRYVYITEQNYSEFVGHEFAVMDENGYQTVTLTEAYITTEYTGCYSLVTVYHFNYFIDGLFSMPGGIEGLFNFFEYDESLKYDEEKMAEDIEKYGLYTYEDFAPYMPEEVYQCFQAPYYKVAVEKGMITFEEIVGLIEKYLVQHGIV
ncbi:MAG: hypothetical protein IJF33_07025, partial [Clostridia bacterium]|nr:hypothetical protein [Clostridia bacterium]